MPLLRDLSSRTFGKLLVLERAAIQRDTDGGSRARWRCLCECGNEVVTRGHTLVHGNIHSCGCTPVGAARGTHGRCKDPVYKVWASMIARCNDPECHTYERYGARGIAVCERWSGPGGFINFIADVGERPDGLTLERIDNDGDYCPSNVVWASVLTQSRNKRSCRLTESLVLEIHGRCEHGQSVLAVARCMNLPYETVRVARRGKTWSEFLHA